MKNKLFNPFVQIAGQKALLIGLGIALLSMALSLLFQARFDGVIDLHFVETVTFQDALFDQFNVLLCVTICLFAIAKTVAKTNVRFIDILGTTSLARFPFLLLPWFNINQKMWGISEQMIRSLTTNPTSIAFESTDIAYLAISSLVSLLAIIWYVTLLYNAYKVSTNLKGGRLVGSFIAGILIAEIVSKITLYIF